MKAYGSTTTAGLTSIDGLPRGLSLQQLEAADRPARTCVFSEHEQLKREAFFHAEQLDPAVARFGGLFTDSDFKTYTAPRTTASAFPQASVLGSSGLVAWQGEFLADSLQSIEPWRASTIVAEAEAGWVRLKRPVRLPGRRLAGNWFHVFTGAWRNYAHWMTECMPKLLLFRWLREHVPELRLLLPEFGSSSFHRRTLELLGVDDAVSLHLGEDDVVTPDVLWYAPIIAIWRLQPICQVAAQHLAAAAVGRRSELTLPQKRIYIRRLTPLRRVANFDALEPVLAACGFAVISTETMTLDEQICTMRSASLVIGEHGAGLVNLMFCQPGSRLLELFNPCGAQPAFWVLASLCKVDYGFLVGSHWATPQSLEPDGNTDYTVSPRQLLRGIQAMLIR